MRNSEAVGFLKLPLRPVAGKVLAIRDGAPIHLGQPVEDSLPSGATGRRQWEVLSGHAPELDPDEGIWNYSNRVRNVAARIWSTRKTNSQHAVKRLRHTHSVLRACLG